MEEQCLPSSTFLIESMSTDELRRAAVRPLHFESNLRQGISTSLKMHRIELDFGDKAMPMAPIRETLCIIPGGRWLLGVAKPERGGLSPRFLCCWDLLSLEADGKVQPAAVIEVGQEAGNCQIQSYPSNGSVTISILGNHKQNEYVSQPPCS